MTSTTRIY